MAPMTDPIRRVPHITAFARALGCGIILRTSSPVPAALRAQLAAFIETYEATLSRFRADSTVSAMANAPHGGSFVFPAWSADLFALYDRLFTATSGAIDPCVGEDLTRLGYGIELGRAFREGESHNSHISSSNTSPASSLSHHHGRAPARNWDDIARNTADRPSWATDVKQRYDPASRTLTLSTRRAVHLDFGAAGKGYLVDLLAGMLHEHGLTGPLVIDAGGDLRVEGLGPDSTALRIGLEDPSDAGRAVGLAQVGSGSLCASSPSRRHWLGAHHLINALDGKPSGSVAASWAFVPINAQSSTYPTAVADGLATALFVTDPTVLRRSFTYECALLDAGSADRTARRSAGFPGSFFMA